MRTLCIICAFFLLSPAWAQVDLHAHLDMKPGLGILLQGDSREPIRANTWDTRILSKASLASLDSFHSPKIIVVSLYGHPFLSHPTRFDWKENTRDALEIEYQHIQQFLSSHSNNFGLARTAQEARTLLTQKKNVFILSIDGAYGALESEADYKKWIDERGVTIVTPFHLSEDHFGGPAFMRPWAAIFNTPLSFLESLLITNLTCLSSYCENPMGMKPDGDILIKALLDRKVWIDLAHANEIEVREILPELEAKHFPMLVTHTQIREVFPAERGVGALEVAYLTKHGGIIGLLPTDDFIVSSNVPSTTGCTEGVTYFKDVFQYAQKRLGEEHVALGSDSNAPLSGLSPHCKSNGTSQFNQLERNGYQNYSQWNELGDYVADDLNWNGRIVEHFLSTWEKVR